MTLIQRQSVLVKELEKVWGVHLASGYLVPSDATVGKRSRAMRLHAEAMMKDGYTKAEGWASARQCLDVAILNASHASYMKQMGATT